MASPFPTTPLPPREDAPPVTPAPPFRDRSSDPRGTPPDPPRRSRPFRLLPVILMCLLSGVAGGIVVRATTPDARLATVPASTTGPTASSAPSSTVATGSNTVAAVAQAAKPSVVTIQLRGGTGSGVITTADGQIITNAHVVEGVSTVTVRLADGTELQGRVLGTDPDVDVAVVKIDRSGLPVAQLGSALTLHSGDQVVAVGNPLGLEGSVSAGVVSALGRSVPEEAGGLRAAIQTDAAINPGNSGGALLDMSGKVVGITAAKAGRADNIGFAIPIDVAAAIARDIASGTRPSHPYLGVSGSEVDAGTATALGSTPGAKLEDVSPGTPAAAAGLKRGDVIVTFDGTAVGSLFDLQVLLATHHAGDRVTVGLSDGRSVSVTLGERPSSR